MLVMIPKTDTPELASQFRPISLCNTIYKCIAKCLVSRLKVVLPLLISDFQHAFILGRHMEDNTFMSQELMHFIKSKDRSSHLATLKVDMSKAYDRVDWLFYSKFLELMDFRHLDPMDFSMYFYSHLQGSYQWANIGFLHSDLWPKTSLKGIKISRRAPSISHLFFVDDAMFFFQCSEESCGTIADILARFGKAFGQQINFSNSFVKFSPSVSLELAHSYKSILRVPIIDNMGKHLGVPIDLSGRKASHFMDLLENIKKKILSWAHCKLSDSAKLILINSVLLGMAKSGDKGIHWINRQRVQLPKSMGGLGIRSASSYNEALLFKNIHRMHTNPQLLPAKVYNAKSDCIFCPHSDCRKPPPASFSWVRRAMHSTDVKMRTGFAWKIGTGHNVLASNSKWVNNKIPVVNSNQNLRQSAFWKVSELITPSRSWNVGIIRDRFEWDSAHEIFSMALPAEEEEDFLYWPWHSKGTYTVKSEYAFLTNPEGMRESPHRKETYDFFKILWRLDIPPKWRIFMWKLVVNGFPVKANLQTRGIITDASCDYCDLKEEDEDWIRSHILLFYSQDGIRSNRIQAFVATLWVIWITRNKSVFQGDNEYLGCYFGNLKEDFLFRMIIRNRQLDYRKLLKLPDLCNRIPPGFFQVLIGQENHVLHFNDSLAPDTI
ncbi:uncharacterized protein LOC110716673 [Chenopodium quinoa]|uniref:uncharacterized protein LOC110716673 n=1 Tax=Chenopodium quinoa TaxID=63459 RepID=UPI000B790C02|nr:uncharacterized protein LOC110716673 [Chenopodium quinoa]